MNMLDFFTTEELDNFLILNRHKRDFRMVINPKIGKLLIFWDGRLQASKLPLDK